MATITELKNRIKVRLSRRNNSILDTEVIDALDHAQREILERSPTLPSYLVESTSLTKTGVHQFISVASDLTSRHLRNITLLWNDPSITVGDNGIILKRYDDYFQMIQLFPGQGETPFGYWHDAYGIGLGSYWLGPMQSISHDYAVAYYAQAEDTPSSPDINDMTPWSKNDGDLLMHTAGVELAQYLRDDVALQYFSAKRQEAHTRFIKRIQAELDSDQEYVMGE